jgi:hypothetical protein
MTSVGAASGGAFSNETAEICSGKAAGSSLASRFPRSCTPPHPPMARTPIKTGIAYITRNQGLPEPTIAARIV